MLNYKNEIVQNLRQALVNYQFRVSSQKRSYEQERYRIDQINRSFLADMPVNEISSVDIASYRDKRLSDINPRTQEKLSTSTVRLELSLLSNFFDIAQIEWGLCSDNPVRKVRKPKPAEGRERRLTPREDRLILRYCHSYSNPELYTIVVLALETAMRQGEILGLKWEDVNLKSRIAHLPLTKNGSKRDVPLSLKARDALIRHGIRTSGKVFNYTKEGLKSTWRTMMVRLKIQDLHFHDLRHEACSRLFEIGTLDMMEVAAISGHKSLSMLKRYTHLKAQKLVKKLEGSRHKGRQVIFDHLVPYPALLNVAAGQFELKLLDFEDLVVRAPSLEESMQAAQYALLMRIINSMRDDASRLPPPDQYLETVDESLIVMIDPLANGQF